MISKCPNCDVSFKLPDGYDSKIKCPTCATDFVPVDYDLVRARLSQSIAAKIESYFQGINDALADRICECLATYPPLPGKGGYRGLEGEIEEFITQAVNSNSSKLVDAMLKAFADAQDWYFSHKLLTKIVPSKQAENHLVNAAMNVPHLGGQSGDYFHLLSILAEKRDDIRSWCERIKQEARPGSILADNLELVLAGRA